MSLLALSWRRVLFAHWALDPGTVAAELPTGLSVDTFDGRAWVGIVPLEITGAGVGTAGGGGFAELNLRTYVRHEGDPGVYFFSLDAADPIAVAAARTAYGLPYYRAEARARNRDEGIRFDHRRTHAGAPPARFAATYEPVGERSRVDPGSLAAFLVERYRYYLRRGGRLWRGDIDHEPWRPAPATATIASNTLATAAGLPELDDDPHLLYAAPDGMAVRAGPPRPVRSR